MKNIIKVLHPETAAEHTEDMLILTAAEHGHYIVCANGFMVNQLAIRAKELGVNIPYPMTFTELKNHRHYGKGIKSFIIHDADELVQELCGRVPVAIMSMTSTKYDIVETVTVRAKNPTTPPSSTKSIRTN